jgi:WD40 repeat protein
MWHFNLPSHSIVATTLRKRAYPVRALRFSPNGQCLISVDSGENGKSNLVASNLTDTDVSADVVLATNSSRIPRFVITADGRWLISASEEPSLRAWDLNAIEKRQSGMKLEGQQCVAQAVVLSKNGRWLATFGIDNTVLVWSVTAAGPMGPPVSIRTIQGNVTDICFADRGNWLVTGSDQGFIQLWNLRVDDLIRVATARFSP